MHSSRRGFLRLAGRACVASVLAVASGRIAYAAGPGHDAVVKPPPLGANGMPMPQNNAPSPDAELARRIKAISNVFEVGRPEPDYGYVENLGDGRGYTVTQYGFCTYNSEVAQVIDRYVRHVPGTPLKRFLPQLPPIKWSNQELNGFAAAWRKENKASKLLGVACDEEADALYFRPAVEAAAAVGIHSAIGKSIFYDTLLQHGASTDPDSLPQILQRTIEENGDVDSSSEAEFLRAFLAIRRAVLEEPANRETREVWRASARRVDALLNLLNTNPDLVPPIEVANADVDVTVL
jgi:Glycosyl hydrolase family 46